MAAVPWLNLLFILAMFILCSLFIAASLFLVALLTLQILVYVKSLETVIFFIFFFFCWLVWSSFVWFIFGFVKYLPNGIWDCCIRWICSSSLKYFHIRGSKLEWFREGAEHQDLCGNVKNDKSALMNCFKRKVPPVWHFSNLVNYLVSLLTTAENSETDVSDLWSEEIFPSWCCFNQIHKVLVLPSHGYQSRGLHSLWQLQILFISVLSVSIPVQNMTILVFILLISL